MCLKHSYISLKLRSLKRDGIDVVINSQSAARNLSLPQLRQKIKVLNDDIFIYEVWKKIWLMRS